jgi:V/A-type H+-transporting ATPase subunit I
LRSTACFIGTIPKSIEEAFRESTQSKFKCAYIEFLSAVKDELGVLILAPNEDSEELIPYLKSQGFNKVSLNYDEEPKKVLENNLGRINELDAKADELIGSMKDCAGHYENFKIAYDYFKTLLERVHVAENFLKTQKTVLLEGWVPEESTSEFKAILDRCCEHYSLEVDAVETDSEEVPIKLKNGKMVAAFEPVTAMYSMPSYKELDPTPLFMPFYLLFFGLMVGDAGYGLIFILGALFALKKFNLTKGARRFIQFFFYLGFGTIFGGIMYGSVFGFSPPFLLFSSYTNEAGEVVSKALLDSLVDIPTMLIVSIVLGIIQIMFGLFVKVVLCIRAKEYFSAFFDAFCWIVAVLCGILLLVAWMVPGSIGDGIVNVTWIVFVITLVALAATQGRDSPSIGGKIGNGLFSVYGISGYVGDVVSYTRITALALSGAYIAFAFSEMASLLPGVLKFTAGAVIILIGGLMNMGLAALGAYVHTCRLQYVEYFGKFYEGGGVPFKPFALKNTFITITK